MIKDGRMEIVATGRTLESILEQILSPMNCNNIYGGSLLIDTNGHTDIQSYVGTILSRSGVPFIDVDLPNQDIYESVTMLLNYNTGDNCFDNVFKAIVISGVELVETSRRCEVRDLSKDIRRMEQYGELRKGIGVIVISNSTTPDYYRRQFDTVIDIIA